MDREPELTLSSADLANGRMPEVCALSGRPTDWMIPVRFGPSWIVALPFLFGAVGGLIGHFLTGRVVTGRLPISPQARRRRAAVVLPSRTLVFAGVVLVAVGVADVGIPFAILGAACLVGGVALLRTRLARGAIGNAFKATGGEYWVTLRNLDPRFIEAYNAQFARREETTAS